MLIKKISEYDFDKINEVLIHPDFSTVTEDGNYIIIALQKYVYFCEYDNDEIMQKIAKIINDTLNVKFKLDVDGSFLDILQEIKDYLPNCLVFEYDMNNSDTLKINIDNEFNQDVNSSKYFIDVLKFLKQVLNVNLLISVEAINNITNYELDMLENHYSIDILIENWEKDIKYRKLTNYVYHGTSMEYLENILKIGLRPNFSPSNFKFTQHKNRIFLTSDKTSAMYYANNTATMTKTPPIILEIETSGIDQAKIDFDFDFYINYIDAKHNFFKDDKTNYNPKTLAHLKNKYIGSTYRKFSYMGSINPKYIEKIYYNFDQNTYDFYNVIDKENFKDFLNMYNDLIDNGVELTHLNYKFDKVYYNDLLHNNELEEVQENKKILLFEDYAKKWNK
jgi:hypothetical protein